MTSTVYRLSLLRSVHVHLPLAEKSRKALTAPANASSSSNSSLAHFTADGWLTPVVNPLNFVAQGTESPEGEAFVLEMQAAWRDWVADGSKGANGGRSLKRGLGWTEVSLGVVLGALVMVFC